MLSFRANLDDPLFLGTTILVCIACPRSAGCLVLPDGDAPVLSESGKREAQHVTGAEFLLGMMDATELQPGAILARAPDLDGGIRYLVRWQGMSHPTWEEERTLRQTNVGTDLLDRFRGQNPGTESCAIDDPDLQEHPEWLEHVL